MDIEAIRKVLAALPDIDSSQLPNEKTQDLVATAESFALVLRKIGVQQMRSGTEVVSAVNRASDRIAAVHETALQERDRAVAAERRLEAMAESLIAHLDFLARATDLMREVGGFDTWIEQFDQAKDRLIADVAKLGLSELGRVGDPFEPQVHDSVNQIQASDGRVVIRSVLRPGYVLDGRVLRNAEVEIQVEE